MILCAIDYSPAAEEATKAAMGLASRLNSKVELVTVVGPVREHFGHSDELSLEGAADIAEMRLATARGKLRHCHAHVDTRVLIVKGGETLRGLLVRYTTEVKPQMVVIGSRRKLQDGFCPMGNFAAMVVESLDVPVLVVHSSNTIGQWANHASKLRIYAGIEFSEESLPVLAAVRHFHDAGDCEFKVCHVKHPWPSIDRLTAGMNATPDLSRDLERDEMGVRQIVRRHMGVWGHTHVEFAALSTDSQLIANAQADKADILVIGTHHRGCLARMFFGSVSRAVLDHSPLNVLVVPLTWHPHGGIVARKGKRRTVRRAAAGGGAD